MRPRRDHRLPGNKLVWTPPRVMFLDTETFTLEGEQGTDLDLRLWQLQEVRRAEPEGAKLSRQWWSGHTGAELAQALTGAVKSRASYWLFAHNLGFDLATTRLPQRLVECGWEWTQGTLTAASPWMRWKRGSQRLTLVDSFSHLPASLAAIGEKIGLAKWPLPDPQDPEDVWLAYCRRDVEVLSQAVLQLLDWWDTEQMGSFSVTGAQTGWNSLRHREPAPDVHISSDPEMRTFARAACYGGRRSVWRVGDLEGGPFVEVDMQLAHAHILRDQLLPVAVLGWLEEVPLDHELWTDGRVGLVADCVVEVTQSRYPYLSPAGVLYPVGRFATRLAWPELLEARRRGELLSVGRALVLALRRPTSAWAGWLIERLSTWPPDVPPMVWLAMKGWSRTVVGKWAARTAREVLSCPSDVQGFEIDAGFYQHPDVPAWTVHLGGQMRVYVRDQEADDAFPAVYAFVTSWQRVLLQRLIDHLGPGSVVQCNTDSVVVRGDVLRPGHRWLSQFSTKFYQRAMPQLEALLGLPPLTVKAVAQRLRILTPEHLVLGEGPSARRRLAGVPASARELDPWVFTGYIWPGLPQQLSIGPREAFLVEHRTVRLSGARPLGWILPGGWVAPPTVVAGSTIHTQLAIPGGLDLAGQHPALVRMTVEQPPEAATA